LLYVLYGRNGEEMAQSVLARLDAAGEITALGKRRPLVAIKPNLVVAQPAEWGATTSPSLVRGVLRYLRENGIANLVIMESSWVGECTKQAFAACGYEELSREFAVPLLDLKDEPAVPVLVAGMEIRVCKAALQADYLINVPVLKVHCQTKLTCALKNLKGCIPDSEKRKFHREGLHRPIAALNQALKSHLVLVDALHGDLCHEEGGTPVRMDRIIAGRDPVLADMYAAELLGFRAEEVPYISLAAQFGAGNARPAAEAVTELNKSSGTAVFTVDHSTGGMQRWISERQACSPCFGSLVHALQRLKEKGKLSALPPVAVGQGFRDCRGQIGVGDCTAGFDSHVPGCPPKGREIVQALSAWVGLEERP
jgi:uncharacterized protein (DUF362 family)